MATPNNIVLRPNFAKFQFPFIELASAPLTVENLLSVSQQKLTPVVTSDANLVIPEVQPGLYATLDLSPRYTAVVDNTITAAESPVPGKILRELFAYTLDGISYQSNLGDGILIEKGSVRTVEITSMLVRLMYDLSNFQSTTVFVPGANATVSVYVTPVIILWY